jgi:hypothetical protein
MVLRYNIQTDDIIAFMQQYNGSLPKYTLQGTHDSSDLEQVFRDAFNMTNFSYKRLIVNMKKDEIIHIQKYKRDGYGMYTYHWLDNNKLLEKFGINVSNRYDNNITNKVVSSSLANNLMNFADNMQNEKKHLWQIACRSIYKKAVNDKQDRHFTINNKGAMTYTPKGRMTSVTDDMEKWQADNKYRSEIKIGKGLRKIFQHQNIKVPSDVIDHFTNKLKGMYTFTGKITEVSGSYIRDWYNGNIYAKYNTESLGNSCMRHSSCQDYFDIYTENDDKVKMIIALDDENMLIGRAILWDTDSHGLFCDRIYGTQMTIEAIKSYAKKLGAYTKYKQSYSDSTIISTTGEAINDEITITLNKGGFRNYPYMDTLKFTDDISNEDEIVLSSESGDYCLESTDGGPNDDYVTLNNGDRVHEDEANYVDRYDEYYHTDDCVYSEYHGEYIVYDRAISIYTNNDYAWDDADDFIYIESAGEYYHVDDVIYSDYENEYILSEETENCVIHGYIHQDNAKTLLVAETEYCVHDDVTIEQLLEAGIITEENYAEYEN